MAILGLILAALVGLSLGLLGGGGSILTVPIFVYALGFAAKEAIAMSLVVVGATSLVGALRHWRAGNVNLRLALAFGAIAMLGSYLGARLARLIGGPTQLALFGTVMILAAVFMFRDRRDGATSEKLAPTSLPGLLLVLLPGFAVGLLTGLVGVGGGFLIVPALVLLARVPMKQAIGTSLLVIALNSASGFAGYLGQVEVRWTTVLLFTALAILGILVGASLAHRFSARTLRRGFAIFVVVMGLFILYQNRAVFRAPVVSAEVAPPAALLTGSRGIR